jgi:hypothetical protein
VSEPTYSIVMAGILLGSPVLFVAGAVLIELVYGNRGPRR